MLLNHGKTRQLIFLSKRPETEFISPERWEPATGCEKIIFFGKFNSCKVLCKEFLALVVSVIVTEELNKKSKDWRTSTVTFGGVEIITSESSNSAFPKSSRVFTDLEIDLLSMHFLYCFDQYQRLRFHGF